MYQMFYNFNECFHIILRITYSQSFKLLPMYIYMHHLPCTYDSTLKSYNCSISKEIKTLFGNYNIDFSNISIDQIQDKDNFVCPHHFYADGKQLSRYYLANHWDISTSTVIHYKYSLPIIMSNSLNTSFLIASRHISHGTYGKQSTITSKDDIPLNVSLDMSKLYEFCRFYITIIIKLLCGHCVEQNYTQNLKKGINTLKLNIWLKQIMCKIFSTIAFLIIHKNKMTKILNKSGKGDNWTSAFKTPIQKTIKRIKYKSLKSQSADNIKYSAKILESGHPTTCMVVDIRIICKISATSHIRLANLYKQPTYPFSCKYAEVNNLARIRNINLRGGICKGKSRL